jgi:5-methylcytosine-specific restriction endonuclease McrA
MTAHVRYQAYLQTKHWQDLKQRKFRESGGQCQHCGSRKRPLDVHHLRYRSLYDVTTQDLLIVCRSCHYQIPHDGKRQQLSLLDFLIRYFWFWAPLTALALLVGSVLLLTV